MEKKRKSISGLDFFINTMIFFTIMKFVGLTTLSWWWVGAPVLFFVILFLIFLISKNNQQ
jgi:hypothetical protein